jgi:hypothetical protein
MIRRMNGIFIVIILVLAACSSNEARQVAVSSLSTQVNDALNTTQTIQAEFAESTRQAELAWTATPSPTDEPTNTAIPTNTYTPIPTETSSATPTPTITATGTPTDSPVHSSYIQENHIVFYLTIIGTGGPIGCGDSLLKLSTGQVKTGDLKTDLKIALNAVFTAPQYVGAFYNATYPSALKVQQIDYKKSSGIATVQFGGSYQKPANACDASRYRSQVWATALQFDEIVRFTPYVGNSLLGDRLAVYSDGGG